MVKRLCPRGHIVQGRRCAICSKAQQRIRDAHRPSPKERGYDAAHVRARNALRAGLPAYCGYGCGTWLEPDGKWHAAHVVDGDPGAGYIAACISCNQRAKRRPAPQAPDEWRR